ncbi:MAG: phosphoglycerate dehydrogenase [Candidatus Omnitrophica bacterium]|nr:phosphoglycerate dehydrogenase [Candidatus Omnitrophota bacterium]
MKVAITTTSFGRESRAPIQLLKKEGLSVAFNPHGRRLEGPEILSLAHGASGVIAGTEDWNGGILEALPELRVISRCGVGTDNVDLEAARKRNVEVLNTPFSATSAVAELTLALILNLLRQVTAMERDLKVGNWSKKMGGLLRGKNVGIVGFGKIGRKVAQILIVFQAHVGFFDPIPGETLPRAETFASLEALLSWSDLVTLHCSAVDRGRALIGRKEIRLMKKGAYLVNTSRGSLVDERALYDAVRRGHLSGAALDVFNEEPYHGPLLELESVLTTPHIGSYALEARVEMEMESAKNLVQALKRR